MWLVNVLGQGNRGVSISLVPRVTRWANASCAFARTLDFQGAAQHNHNTNNTNSHLAFGFQIKSNVNWNDANPPVWGNPDLIRHGSSAWRADRQRRGAPRSFWGTGTSHTWTHRPSPATTSPHNKTVNESKMDALIVHIFILPTYLEAFHVLCVCVCVCVCVCIFVIVCA